MKDDLVFVKYLSDPAWRYFKAYSHDDQVCYLLKQPKFPTFDCELDIIVQGYGLRQPDKSGFWARGPLLSKKHTDSNVLLFLANKVARQMELPPRRGRNNG